jgi:cell division protein FtsB
MSARTWYWLALVVVVGLLCVYAQRRDIPSVYSNYLESEDKVRKLEERLPKLEAQREQLERSVGDLGVDSLELEAAIREGQGLVREGETVYEIESPPSEPVLQ